MVRATVTFDDHHNIVLEEVQKEETIDSKSGAVRHCIEAYEELHRLREELHHKDERIDELQARIDDLRNQLATTNQRIDANNELVEHVREQRSITQRRAQAGVLTRARWWLTGMSDENE